MPTPEERASEIASQFRSAAHWGDGWGSAEVFAERQIHAALAAQAAEHERALAESAMRALMVLVHDEIISSDRAREIVGMTHEQQRQFWRDEHAATLAQARAEVWEEAARIVGQLGSPAMVAYNKLRARAAELRGS